MQRFRLTVKILSGERRNHQEGLPGAVRYPAYVNPLTYEDDGLRAVLVGTSSFPVLVNFGAVLVSSVAMLAISASLVECVEAT